MPLVHLSLRSCDGPDHRSTKAGESLDAGSLLDGSAGLGLCTVDSSVSTSIFSARGAGTAPLGGASMTGAESPARSSGEDGAATELGSDSFDGSRLRKEIYILLATQVAPINQIFDT